MGYGNCLDKVEGWLHEMGLTSTERAGEYLVVTAQTQSGYRYYIYFSHTQQDFIVYESPFFPTVSGDDRGVSLFYQSLNGINGTIYPLYFGTIDTEYGARIALRGARDCASLTPQYLAKHIILVFNALYYDVVPRVKSYATELGLVQDGVLTPSMRKLIYQLLGFEDGREPSA